MVAIVTFYVLKKTLTVNYTFFDTFAVLYLSSRAESGQVRPCSRVRQVVFSVSVCSFGYGRILVPAELGLVSSNL